MFQSIDFTPFLDIKSTSPNDPIHWAGKTPFIRANPKIEFKPGLNILYGPNGSGKSTIIKALALHLAAVQGGQSTVTGEWLREALDHKGNPTLTYETVHDGQPVVFVDSRETIGLVGGMAGFDYDFTAEGLQSIFAMRQSHGQVSMSRLDRIAFLLGKGAPFPKEIVNKLGTSPRAETAQERYLKARCPLGQPSVLLDEPESNLSVLWSSNLWRLLSSPGATEKYQIIVASHSPFSLGLPNAHYIELEEGYLAKAIKLYTNHFIGQK